MDHAGKWPRGGETWTGRPEVIEEIHHRFLEAGSHIIETNTFGSTAVAQADYGLESAVRDMNLAAVAIARRAVDAWNERTPDRPRFVAGAIGPTPNKKIRATTDPETLERWLRRAVSASSLDEVTGED